MEILQVVTDTDRRGAQVFATDLHPALEALGHRVRTVALQAGSHTESLDLPVLGRRRRGPDTLWRLRNAMAAADIAIAHGSATLAACAAVGLHGPTPFVYRQISDSLFWASSRFRRARVSALLRRAARVVALAPRAAAVLEEHFGVAPEALRVIPNGVPDPVCDDTAESGRADTLSALGLDPSLPTALYVGALVPEKGVEIAIQAVEQLPSIQLVIAGAGPELERLRRQAEGCAGRVRFIGSVASPWLLYQGTDVVLLPSRGGDTMPAVLIEAGLGSRPSVTTPIGAIEEVVLDGRTGRVVPVGDQRAFTAAIGEILNNEDLARSWGRAARVHCLARFEIGVVARVWDAVLQEVASAATSRPDSSWR